MELLSFVRDKIQRDSEYWGFKWILTCNLIKRMYVLSPLRMNERARMRFKAEELKLKDEKEKTFTQHKRKRK